jgi:hypothetical protein
MVKLGDIIRWKIGSATPYLVVQDGKTFKLLSLDGDSVGSALLLYADSSARAVENGSAFIIGNYFDIPNK